jgi:thiosulfate/3-mercaptopyruvate sulfurtransferase
MAHTTIVSTDELAVALGDTRWAVVDVRFDLADSLAGRRAYEAGHIPGAVFADLNKDLSAEPGGRRGRHPLPPLPGFIDRVGRWGIDARTQVVVYDDAGGAFAARLWWLLRLVGHDAVAVLDGGIGKWLAEGKPVRAGLEAREPKQFAGSVRGHYVADIAAVDELRRDPTRALIDARAPDRFQGLNETLDPVAGHIPGARNRFFKDNLNADATLKPPDALRAELETVLAGVSPDRAVVYCGSGVTACQNLLALEHAGMAGARLYPGSWSEWCSDPNRPIASGPERDS